MLQPHGAGWSQLTQFPLYIQLLPCDYLVLSRGFPGQSLVSCNLPSPGCWYRTIEKSFPIIRTGTFVVLRLLPPTFAVLCVYQFWNSHSAPLPVRCRPPSVIPGFWHRSPPWPFWHQRSPAPDSPRFSGYPQAGWWYSPAVTECFAAAPDGVMTDIRWHFLHSASVLRQQNQPPVPPLWSVNSVWLPLSVDR